MKILIVEDEAPIAERLFSLYRELFTPPAAPPPQIDHTSSALKAIQWAKICESEPYDLVSLDISLDESGLTGLDVLEEFARHKSAWMVAVFTGIETDANADSKHTKQKAETLRTEFRSAVGARFPSDRVMILEKPSKSLPAAKRKELFQSRINQVVHNYRRISPSRYLFRRKTFRGQERAPSKGRTQKGKNNAKPEFVQVEGAEWEIRMGCENIRTIPDYAGMTMLQQYLSLYPGETLAATQILHAEPDKKRAKHVSDDENLFDSWLKKRGYKIKQLAKDQREQLKKTELQPLFNEYIELRKQQSSNNISRACQERWSIIEKELGDYQPLAAQRYDDLKSEHLLRELKSLRGKEDNGTLTAKEAKRLESLQSELGIDNPDQSSDDSDLATTDFGSSEHVETTVDPTALKDQKTGHSKSQLADLVRQRKKHVFEYLQKNGFQELVEHLKESIIDGAYKPKPARTWLTKL